jgi:predicted dehydrogenase
MKKVKAGIIGCGNISPIYLQNMTKVFDILEVKAVVDLIKSRSQNAAEKWGIPIIYDTDEEMFNDSEIEIILNITTPPDHGWLCMQALEAGKHVYVEKPLSIEREDGLKIKQLAQKKGLLAGGAPDTFLGGGIQTCRKLIEDGWIGEPIGCTAFMTCHGHESWHPDPEFYYKTGGGPMFDMGPYYLTALVNLMGPVESVAGSTRITFPTRTITSEKKYGSIVDVEVPTHVAGLMNFKSGAIGTIITSFDVWAAELPRIEIYGSLGTLSVPDPNTFGGPVKFIKPGMDAWQEIPILHGYSENSRGLGVADMAMALRTGRKHRASVELTYHVLDIMHAFHDACREGLTYRLSSTCEKPAPMPVGLLKGMLD